MNETIGIRKRNPEETKKDPLQQAWIAAEDLYLKVLKRYSSSYKEQLAKARIIIEENLREVFGEEIKTAGDGMRSAFAAYMDVHEEPPYTKYELMTDEELRKAMKGGHWWRGGIGIIPQNLRVDTMYVFNTGPIIALRTNGKLVSNGSGCVYRSSCL